MLYQATIRIATLGSVHGMEDLTMMVSIEIVTSRHHGILFWGFMAKLSHLKPGDFFSGDGQPQKCKKIALKRVKKWAMEKIPGFSRFTSTKKWRISKSYVLLTRILAILQGFPNLNPKSPFKFRFAAGKMELLHVCGVFVAEKAWYPVIGDWWLSPSANSSTSDQIKKLFQGPRIKPKEKSCHGNYFCSRSEALRKRTFWPMFRFGKPTSRKLARKPFFHLDCSGGPRVAFCQDRT